MGSRQRILYIFFGAAICVICLSLTQRYQHKVVVCEDYSEKISKGGLMIKENKIKSNDKEDSKKVRFDFSSLIPSVYDDDRLIMQTMGTLDNIPPILHLSWKNSDVPAFAYDNFIKWKATHSNWTIIFWTDEDVHQYVKTVLKNSELAKTYNKFQKNIVKMDFSRYVILFTIGGVYADIDVTPLRRLESVIAHHSCIIAREPEPFPVSIMMENTILASNFFMASRPGHPFWPYLMEKVKGRGGFPLAIAGPLAVTDSLRDYSKSFPLAVRNGAVYLAPSLYFDPPHGKTGDKIHLDMLHGRCNNWKERTKKNSPFTKRVCRIRMEENRIDFEAMYQHPKFYNHSFIHHGMFNSWNSNSASKVKYKSIKNLNFSFTSPKSLYKDTAMMTPYEREREIIKNGLEDKK